MLASLLRTNTGHQLAPRQEVNVTLRKVEPFTGLPTPFFNVRMVISNPSPRELKLSRVEAEATCQGLPVGSFTQAQDVTVPARSKVEVKLTHALSQQVVKAILNSQPARWELQVTCHFQDGGDGFQVTRRLGYVTENQWGSI